MNEGEIRAAIQRGDIARARALLDSVRDRGAEWFFLMGAVYYRQGWMDEALRHYEAAARMEPENPEYRQAAERMQNGPRGQKTAGTLLAEGLCLGLGGAYVLCQACGCCGTCGACCTCLHCIGGMPR